ncbi:type II toxin-antitoxin system YoeB family toxin [Streptomyces sp. NPDC012888]
MRSVHFGPAAWEDFLFWLSADRRAARRMARLIEEIQRTPFKIVKARYHY